MTTFIQQIAMHALIGIGVLSACNAGAQEYPSRTITIIVPFSAGGGVDTVARLLAEKIKDDLHQAVIVDNKPGGNSLIGAREAIRSPADGHTLFHGNINNALNDLFPNTNCCRLGESLLPVTRIFSTPLVLVVNPQVPAKTLKEFLALAKAQPELLTYASGGNGSITQLLGELVKINAGVTIREVPYKAIGAELPDVLAGHVNAAYLAPVVVAQHINSPAAKAHGLEMGYEYGSESPEEFGNFIKSEIKKWGGVMKDAKIKVE